MFTIARKGTDRVDLEWHGKLDRVEMTRLVDELVRACDGIEHGRMLYRVGDFDLPTFGALVVEFKNLPALWKAVRGFEKCALIAPQSWVRRVGELEGALIPGLEIEAFEPGDDAAAEAWLAE